MLSSETADTRFGQGRRRDTGRDLDAGVGTLLPGNSFVPLKRIRWLEMTLWSFAIFLLTSPFTFWAIATDPVTSTIRDVTTLRNADASQWRLYAMRMAVLLMGMLLTVRTWRFIALPLRRLWPVVPFIAWASLTIIWSDSPVTSSNSVLALLMLLLAAMFLCFRLSFSGAARALVLASFWVLAVSLVFALVFADYGVHQQQDVTDAVHTGAWRGSYLHKNHLGQVCAVFVVALVLANANIFKSRVLKWGMIAALCGLIALSTSASGAITVPTALVLHYWLIKMKSARRLGALVLVIPVALGGWYLALQVLVAMGKDTTLTGRTEVWRVAWEWFSERPLFGYGFNTLTYGGFSFELWRKRGLIDPHNGYFETAMGTGLIGLALFLIPLAVATYHGRRHYAAGGVERDASVVFSGVLIAWMISSFTEVDFRPFAAAGGLGYFALCALLIMPRPERSRQARARL